MKLRSFLFLAFICLITLVNSKTNNIIKELFLFGQFEPNGSRSVVQPTVTAMQSDKDIILNFIKAVGVIDVVVSGVDGVVYSTTLNVTDATQFSIYVGDFEAGAYLLELQAATGGSLYGEFVIE